MKTEKSIEIDDRVARDVDGRTHGVVSRLAVRDHDVQAVGRAPLEDDHQAFVARAAVDCRKCRASQEPGDSSRADHRESTVAKKYSASDGHTKPLLASSYWLLAYDQRLSTNDY